MRRSFLFLLVLLIGCSAAPLKVPERLGPDTPKALIPGNPPPESVSLDWAPWPIEDFIISQAADSNTGRGAYQDFAVGRLISQRVTDFIGTVSRVVPDGAQRALVRIEDATFNYKYTWTGLAYVKLTINARITVGDNSLHKVYYQQVATPPDMRPDVMLQSVFDHLSIELGQDILMLLSS